MYDILHTKMQWINCASEIIIIQCHDLLINNSSLRYIGYSPSMRALLGLHSERDNYFIDNSN